MKDSRTPVLDARLASAGCPGMPVEMTAEEAYRAADALFRENPRLRTPELDRRIAGARDEFGNPDYVDAILRNMASLPPRSAYNERRLPALARSDTGECPDSIAEVAADIVALSRKLDNMISENGTSNVPAQLLDELENRVAAFLAPFDEIQERVEDIFPDTLFEPAAIYSIPVSSRSLAQRLELPRTATTRLLLRYSILPARRYVQGIRRLGIRCAASAVRKGWLLATLLDYPGSEDPAGRAAQFSRMSRVVFAPLAAAGRRSGILKPEPTAQVPTLF